MKPIKKYQWEDIGIEHSQYFSGCGTAYTDWEDVYVGIGEDVQEALEDALDNAATSDWDVERVKKPKWQSETVSDYLARWREQDPATEEEEEEEEYDDTEIYYHVALYVR